MSIGKAVNAQNSHEGTTPLSMPNPNDATMSASSWTSMNDPFKASQSEKIGYVDTPEKRD